MYKTLKIPHQKPLVRANNQNSAKLQDKNTQKLVVLLCTNNLKRKSTIPFTIIPKESFEIHLTKEAKDSNTKNHKTLLKEIKEGINKWKDIPCSWIGKSIKEYEKAVYCLPAYLTYMLSSSCKMPGWIDQKLVSRLPGQIAQTRASLVAQWLRICLQCRRSRFDPWVGKIPWRRKWQPTPVFLPGEAHGQRRLAGYSTWGHKSQTWLSD